MKKIIITLAFASFALASQAQLFVGGQVGFNSNSRKFDGDKTRSSSSFTLSPTIGYQLDEKMAIGARINFGTAKNTTFKWFGDNDRVTKFTGFGLEVFGQYTFLELGKFSAYADAGLRFGLSKAKTTTGSETSESNPLTGFGLNIRPVLAYNLSEKITLLANLNFMGFSFDVTTEKHLNNDNKKTTETDFGLNVNSNDVISGGNVLTIGMIYKF
jgi:hypothetical protein